MHLFKLTLACIAVVAMAGCAGSPTMAAIKAGHSGCDPRSPVLEAFTPQFNACKANFPDLEAQYKAKEDRKVKGECSPFHGDRCFY